MSKLSFRARPLDACKPMPIYMAEELPDLPDYSVINRTVPQMPTGMQEEEECEHHLQRAICAGLIIPTPEVSDIQDQNFYEKLYPVDYTKPHQLIHMQPFTMEQELPDYDMDSEDEKWLDSQSQRFKKLNADKFEEMMDRLEKSSEQTVVTLPEAKALLKEEDDLIDAVFDYWLNKRWTLQRPLLLAVKTEHRAGQAVNNPYIAFRRRTEKMQTRKNRKNDETSYEKMLKLRRDLAGTISMLDMVKKRENVKRDLLRLKVQVFEKRYQAKDYAGAVAAEFAASQKAPRPAFTPIFQNNYANHVWNNKAMIKDENQRNPKRPYKKRKHKPSSHNRVSHANDGLSVGPAGSVSSDEETLPAPSPEPDEPEEEGVFAFRRNKNCSYHMPLSSLGDWPWCSGGGGDSRYRYTLTSIARPQRRCVGFARRRLGRGGRVILDRLGNDVNDFWQTMDFTVYDSLDYHRRPDAVTSSSGALSDECASRTDVMKVEPSPDVTMRTRNECSTSTSNNHTISGEAIVIKEEPVDTVTTTTTTATTTTTTTSANLPTKEEQEEMLEILQTVRREWLHFRPKTPPPEYQAPCHLLPADELFVPTANTPFTLELHPNYDEGSTTRDVFGVDASAFMSEPFLLDYDIAMEEDPVPITDTRQPTTTPAANHHDHLHTLITSSLVDDDDVDSGVDEATRVGCSRYTITESAVCRPTAAMVSPVRQRQDKQCNVSSTFTSPKLMNSSCGGGGGGGGIVVNEVRALRTPAPTPTSTTNLVAIADTPYDSTISNANGIVSQFIEGGGNNRVRMSKYESFNHPYARPPVSNSITGGSGGGGNSAYRSLHHSSAHAVTLNSHSANNILEIPMSTEAVADAVTKGHQRDGGAGATSPTGKAKTIVRKNLVMEVT